MLCMHLAKNNYYLHHIVSGNIACKYENSFNVTNDKLSDKLSRFSELEKNGFTSIL